jgi:hypothetical protein
MLVAGDRPVDMDRLAGQGRQARFQRSAQPAPLEEYDDQRDGDGKNADDAQSPAGDSVHLSFFPVWFQIVSL